MAANSSSCSFSAASAPGAVRNSTTAPIRKIAIATLLTSTSGSSVASAPTVTATSVCTPNARPTPIHTASGLYRVDSTSAAMKVLSGSSTMKIAAKVVAMTARSMES